MTVTCPVMISCTAGSEDIVDLSHLSEDRYTIDDRTHITIDGQQFEFTDFEIILLKQTPDYLNVPMGPTGWTLRFADATDTLSYDGYANAITFDFTQGQVSGSGPDYFTDVEHAIGTAQDDRFIMSEGKDLTIDGLGGDDTLDYGRLAANDN